MTSEVPEEVLAEELAEEFVGEPPAGDATPEEYMSNDQSAVSEDTGTVYDERGEAEATPHDLEPEEDEGDEV